MADVKITVLPNGPLLVEGEVGQRVGRCHPRC